MVIRYRCIVKVSTGTQDTFLKYRTTDLLKFTAFLDSKHPSWKWYNVYDKHTGDQVGSYTVNSKPSKRYIE